jgi:hypothetical protein
MRWLLMAFLSACAGAERSSVSPTAARGMDAGSQSMSALSCDEARRAIEERRFVGWRGLPADCTPVALFRVPYEPDAWSRRHLGRQSPDARVRGLDIPGYYRASLTAVDGIVIMFDAMHPTIEGSDALLADLGQPEAVLDWMYGTLPMPRSEHIHASRGITVFLNLDTGKILHIAVYPATTASDYIDRLRPDLEKKELPRRWP